MKRFLLIAGAALIGAGASDDTSAPTAVPQRAVASDATTDAMATGRIIYGIDESNRLVSFKASTPQQILSVAPLTGLTPGDRVVAIDFRPADGSLIGLGTSSRLYRINPTSGASTALGASTFAPSLAGRMFGVDFNPTVDRFRVHTDAEQNLRLEPVMGAVVGIDTALAYVATDPNAGVMPNVVGTAYTNSALNNGTPATSTTLFALDQATRALVVLPAPNGGLLRTVGPLGVTFGSAAGFDIATRDNIAYASLNTGTSRTGLYRINLGTGVATRIGDIGHVDRILGISVRP